MADGSESASIPGLRRAAEIETLFEADVVAHAAGADAAHLATLHPDERLAAAAMVDGRAAEYATARACARASLAVLGTKRSLPRLPSGAPDWPTGISGSISHTGGTCAAVAVGADRQVIGLDIERVDRVRAEIARRILSDGERSSIADLPPEHHRRHVAVAFAAKEAFYKAHHQLEPRYLGFGAISLGAAPFDLDHPVDLAIAVGDGSVDGAVIDRAVITVRIADDHVVAAATIERDSR